MSSRLVVLLGAICASCAATHREDAPVRVSPPPAERMDRVEDSASPIPPILGLAEIHARILEHANLWLAADVVRVEEAEAREDEASLWPNPYVLLRERRIDDFDPRNTGVFELEVGQTFELGGKRAARAAKAQAAAALVSEQVRALTAATLRDAELAYFHALRLGEDLARAREQLDVSTALAGLAGERFASGKESRFSVLRSEAAAEKARVEVQAVERRLAQTCLNLDELVGAEPGSTTGVEGVLSSAVLGPLDRDAARARLTLHPRLRATDLASEAATREIESARADVWPDVTVGLAYEHLNDVDENLSGLVFRLPLPLWNRAQGRRAEARAALRRSQLSGQAESLRLAVELDRAFLAYDQAVRSAEDYAVGILPRLEESFRLAQASFDVGRISHFEVLDAHLDLIQARRAHLDYLEERAAAAAEIRYLVGVE